MAYTPIPNYSLLVMPTSESTNLYQTHWDFYDHELVYDNPDEYYEDYEYADIIFKESTLINSKLSMIDDNRFETIAYSECSLDNYLIEGVNTNCLELIRTRVTDLVIDDSRIERLDLTGVTILGTSSEETSPQYSIDSLIIQNDSVIEYMIVNNYHIKKLILDVENEYDCLVMYLRQPDTLCGTVTKIDEIVIEQRLHLVIKDYTGLANQITISSNTGNKTNVQIIDET